MPAARACREFHIAHWPGHRWPEGVFAVSWMEE
jgi:hypothetical protein